MACKSDSGEPFYSSAAYRIFKDQVVQGAYSSKALSATELVSTYRSPANPYKKSIIDFKFAINGKDNEMVSGIDHHFNVLGTGPVIKTPLIKFGQALKLGEHEESGYIKPNTKLLVQLDLREILDAFSKAGYFEFFNGERLYKQDFSAVYIAGSTAPMTWDFSQLTRHPELELKDPDGDGIYEVLLEINEESIPATPTEQGWKLSKDISSYPALQSDFILTDALYNMALEEMVNAIEPDSTFRTGKEWAGVWTRDISYSILLSMAYMQPEVARNSLLKKVNARKKIIQDTGTGGAWPVSSDRMIWAIAAWEIYLAEGDLHWMAQAFEIITNTLQDDYQTIYDPASGLVKGESSFLDWREQTYPAWMQPADIFESKTLSTNAVHYQANRVAARMADLLGSQTNAAAFNKRADQIREAVNRLLWIPGKKYYAQYLYGRGDQLRSARTDALGEALAVLFDLATPDQQKELVSNTPVTSFGIPCIYPDIPGIPPYHNNAVWPFVQAFWLMAASKAGNEAAVLESMAAIYRPAALFLTNKENLVAENGDFKGTQINSSNMLWSLSGHIGMVHKTLFGIQFTEEGLRFQPFIPQALAGNRVLKKFRYRGAVLDIEINGYGNQIRSFSLNGVKTDAAIINKELTGSYTVKIELDGPIPPQRIYKPGNYTSLAEPKLGLDNDQLYWLPQSSVKQYKLFRNGELLKLISGSLTSETITEPGRYQLMALDEAGVESFASEPVEFFQAVEIPLSANKLSTQPVAVTIQQAGVYDVDVEYANGNGPINTDNKCAIRTLLLNEQPRGVLVFPQRGKDNWTSWGYSNSIRLHLSKGTHVLLLAYQPYNENMSGHTNTALFKKIRLRKIK
ncbi:hypothetical protein [Flavihumibacter sp. CACIAM 22H1]|uniref:alpha-L-rhamnosidase-related protein n=1 Tax=Flavihumibacter sp. CACIAM 22H1 TaxID=1812911 RepID=UPI0007A7D348|nr:hypothetical protein [Flavihumibacter sp. CACIAM 22H1]KYP14063.1 MAG: hypothetical protein A1D16_11950 [Flavihumibacter sp. CACIAM 22H1]